MRLFKNVVKFLFNKFIRRYSTGKCIYVFCKEMGIAYIKVAQILSMWNVDKIFTEQDRLDISSICDNCKPVPVHIIKKTLYESYGGKPTFIKKVYRRPIGTASVSQVHKAVLINGDVVALKIKRRDLENTIHSDIITIRKVMNRFGKLLGFSNSVGINTALSMYEDWLGSEIDFRNEAKNIREYTKFANSVNEKVPGCKRIVLPKLYEEYCTDDVIVMEYIPYKTLNEGTYSASDIRAAIDSYLKLSFYALLHDIPVYFHGDPHMGNLYLDNDGNVGFLDMGLVFNLTQQEQKDTIDFLMCAFYGDSDRLYDKLKNCVLGSNETHLKFKKELDKYCSDIGNKAICNYFVDLMLVCFDYNIVPPPYLFKMAKAFIYLGGAEVLFTSTETGHELIGEQMLEYLLEVLLNIHHDTETNMRKAALGVIRKSPNDVAASCYNLMKDYSSIKSIVDKIIHLM